MVVHERNDSEIVLDGGKLRFTSRDPYVSELYNEQISLLCNSEGANLISKMAAAGGASSNLTLCCKEGSNRFCL